MGKAGSSFRKPASKKSFTKKDIIYTSILVGAVVIAIAIFAILVSSDDFIRTKDGVLQAEPNWLVGEFEKKNNVGYYKIGEIGDMENYYIASAEGSTIKYIFPSNAESSISMAYAGTTGVNYAEFAELLAIECESRYELEDVAPEEMTVAGHKALYIFAAAAETAADETPAEEVPAEETPAEETADEHEHSEEEEHDHSEEEEHDHSEEEADEHSEDDGHDHDHDQIEELSSDVPAAYLMVDYDGERTVMVELVCAEETTAEEAAAAINEIAAAITLQER